MKLPSLMLVTSRHQMKPSFEYSLESALLGGAALVQLREQELKPAVFSYMAQLVAQLCRSYNATLLINGQVEIARSVADGVHLPEAVLQNERLPEIACKGVSVHSIENARRAAELGADYVIFGSVFATSSHPENEPAGLEALHQVAQAVDIPVFAIGGISAANAKSCLEAGAHGVAVMSTVWQAADAVQAVRDLREVLE